MVDENKEVGSVSVSNCILSFCAIYTGLIILVQVMTYMFAMDLGSGASIMMLVVAAMGAAMKFTQKHKRAPGTGEKRSMIWLSLISAIFISLVASFLTSLILGGSEGVAEVKEIFASVSMTVWAVVFLLVLALHYVILSVIYGPVARSYCKKIV